MPTGPVLSPDDPRYGRPAGPPAVIYADRPPGSQQPAYSDRGDSRIPGAGIVYPNDDRAGLRPPGAIGDSARAARCRNRSNPPSEPTAGRCSSPRCRRKSSRKSALRSFRRNLRRQEVTFATKEPAGTIVVDTVQHPSLLHTRRRPRDPLRRPRRPRRLHLERRAEDQPQGRVAGLASADRDDRASALSAALHGRRPRQSARRARDVSRFDHLPHPRHQPAFDDRQVRLLGLHRHAERGRLGPVRARQGRHPRGGAARRPAARQHRAAAPAAPLARLPQQAPDRHRPNWRPFPARSRRWCRRCPRPVTVR